MGAFRLTRSALSVITAGVLSACGGSSPLAPTPGAVNNGVAPLIKSKTFNFTGGEQRFRVPNGVTSLTVVVRGAQGGGKKGGRGGRVYAVIPVSPRETLHVYVGGQGIDHYGGFNGGADGGVHLDGAFGGGGASDIRIRGLGLTNRVIVAGGGGGEAELCCRTYVYGAAGGKGGGSTGGAGQLYPGGGSGGDGGSQHQGGVGGRGGPGAYKGVRGADGGFGVGGLGGAGCRHYPSCAGGQPGGGGGGGYYGGGGGGAGGSGSDEYHGGGGGGGGSSYAEPKAKKFQSWQGWKNAFGNGLVVISWK